MDKEMFESALYESLKLKVLMCQFCCMQMECPPSPRCPKLLECSHTFCFVCLRGLVEGTGIFSRVLCPSCGDETKIGLSGIVGLGTNLTVVKILEIFQEISQDSMIQLYNGLQLQNLQNDVSAGRAQSNELLIESNLRRVNSQQREIQNIQGAVPEQHQQKLLNDQRLFFPSKVQSISFQQQHQLHQEKLKHEIPPDPRISNQNSNLLLNSPSRVAVTTQGQGNADIYDTLEFPTKLLGRLIGLRGDTIKGIRERTLCSIEIRKPPKGNLAAPSRVIFRGTPEQIQEAQLLVYDVLVPNSSMLPLGGGGSGLSDTLSTTSFESTDSLDAYGNPHYTYYTPTNDSNDALSNSNNNNSILLRRTNFDNNQDPMLKDLSTDNTTTTTSTQDFLSPWAGNTPPSVSSSSSIQFHSHDSLPSIAQTAHRLAEETETPNSYHTAVSSNTISNSINNNINSLTITSTSSQSLSDNNNFYDTTHYLLVNNNNTTTKNSNNNNSNNNNSSNSNNNNNNSNNNSNNNNITMESSFTHSVYEALNAKTDEDDDNFLFQNIMDYGLNLDNDNNINNNNNNISQIPLMSHNVLNSTSSLLLPPSSSSSFYNQNVLQDTYNNNNNNNINISHTNDHLISRSYQSGIDPLTDPSNLLYLNRQQQQQLHPPPSLPSTIYPSQSSNESSLHLTSTTTSTPSNYKISDNKIITSRLECSMERLGRLIGLNGARITEIRNRSNAKIVVTKGLPCKIDFCGTREQILLAEVLVYQALGLKYPSQSQAQALLAQTQTRPQQSSNINTNSLSRSMSKSPAAGSTTSDDEFNNFYDSSDGSGGLGGGGGGGRGGGGSGRSTPNRNSASFKFYEDPYLDNSLATAAAAAAALSNESRHFNMTTNNINNSISNINSSSSSSNNNPSMNQLINPFSGIPDISTSVQQVHMIECPYLKIAAVIGKRGVMINGITEQSGCKISIDQNVPDGAPCKIKLMGLPHQIHCAKDLINSVITSSYSHYSNNNSGRQSQNTSRDQYDSDVDLYSKDIFIPSNLVPLLIGSGGSTVHELQVKSGAHIQVDSDNFTSAPRRVKVSGTVESVNLAVELLQRQLCLTEPKSRTLWDEAVAAEGYPSGLDSQGNEGSGFRYDTNSSSNDIVEDEFVCQHSKVALVIGKRGAVVREIKRRANCHIVIDNTVTRLDSNPNAEGVQRMVFSGTREQVDAGMALVKAVLQVGAVDALDMLTEHMECPHSKVSVLIGTNGSTVKEIMKRSNCRIVVHENLNDDPSRTIEMTGTPQQIETAKGMIASVLDFGSRAVLKSFGGLL